MIYTTDILSREVSWKKRLLEAPPLPLRMQVWDPSEVWGKSGFTVGQVEGTAEKYKRGGVQMWLAQPGHDCLTSAACTVRVDNAFAKQG